MRGSRWKRKRPARASMKTVHPEECSSDPAVSSEPLRAQLLQACRVLRVTNGTEGFVAGGSFEQRSTTSSTEYTLSRLSLAFAEIIRTQKLLVDSGQEASAELRDALSEYQQLLQEFKSNFPQIRGWLLAERTRLASRRSHSSAVESWVRASQQTRAFAVKTKPG